MKRVKENADKRDAYWMKMNTEWKNSGLSQGEFCKEQNLSYSMFVYWRSKLLSGNNGHKNTDNPLQMPFAGVKVNAGQIGRGHSEIKIRLPTGVMLIADSETPLSHLREILNLFGVLE